MIKVLVKVDGKYYSPELSSGCLECVHKETTCQAGRWRGVVCFSDENSWLQVLGGKYGEGITWKEVTNDRGNGH